MTKKIQFSDNQATFTFSNGITVSIVNHRMAYGSDNTAEIAAWTEDGNWWVFDNEDTVLGYQTPEQIVHWMKFFSEYKDGLPFPVIEHDEDENRDK